MVDGFEVHGRQGSLDARGRQHRLDLGTEHHALAVIRQIQRLDADAIAHQVHRIFTGIVDRDRKHAVEPADEVDSFALIEPQDDLGVRVGVQRHAVAPKHLGELDEIEDFAVLHHCDQPVVGHHGLVAAGDVDDREPPVADRGAPLRLVPDALVVGPAVHQLESHVLQHAVVQRAASAIPVPEDATHQLLPLPDRRLKVKAQIRRSSKALCSRTYRRSIASRSSCEPSDRSMA